MRDTSVPRDGAAHDGQNEPDGEWVLLSTYDDPSLARMTLDFLRNHGLDVETRGDSPEGVRNYVALDIRLVVRASRLEEAREALAAFTAEPSPETPFRGPLPPPELAGSGDGDGDEANADASSVAIRKKQGLFAFALALLVPIGGGHFYAHHQKTGFILAVAVVGLLTGASLAPHPSSAAEALAIGAGTVVLLDALLSMLVAVRRHNERRIPSAGTQQVTALAIVGVAIGAGIGWSQFSDAANRRRAAVNVVKCEDGDASACIELARWFERENPSADPQRIQYLYRRACSRGDDRGCRALTAQ